MFRVARIGKQLLGDLSDFEGELGRIGRVWNDGFLTTHEKGRVLYFFRTQCLHVPFGICLEGPMQEWISKTNLQEGDLLWMGGKKMYFPSKPDWVIPLEPKEVFNLEVEHPRSAIPFYQITGMIDAIAKHLPAPVEFVDDFWGRSGEGDLPATSSQQNIERMVMVLMTGNAGGLLNIFKGWIGRGPGLTPSGDDSLVGFLGGWRAFSEMPLFSDLSEPEVQEFLSMVRLRTTRISAELIHYAMRGCFSELLYDLLAALREPDISRDLAGRLESLLQWGSSSGRNTLDGVMLSLKVLLLSGSRTMRFDSDESWRL